MTLARELGAPDARSSARVQMGTLLALLIQRRALGLSPDLEGLEVSDTGVLSAIPEPTCTHRPPVVPDARPGRARSPPRRGAAR